MMRKASKRNFIVTIVTSALVEPYDEQFGCVALA